MTFTYARRTGKKVEIGRQRNNLTLHLPLQVWLCKSETLHKQKKGERSKRAAKIKVSSIRDLPVNLCQIRHLKQKLAKGTSAKK